MQNPSEQPTRELNLQFLEATLSLTKEELDNFKKLPKEEQDKLNQEKLNTLTELHKKQEELIQEATQTGNVDKLEEAKRTQEKIEKGIRDLQQQIDITNPELPEGAIKMEVTIGGKTKEELIKEMERNKIYITKHVKSMIDNPEFTTSKKQEDLNLVKISIKDFGFSERVEINEIYEKAKELGLELCPAEVGPQLRLQYKDQPNSEWIAIGTKPISDSSGGPFVFVLDRNKYGKLRLFANYARSSDKWREDGEFIFSLPRK